MGQGPATVRRLRRVLPEGSLLPEGLWQRRHHSVVVLLWLSAAGLAAFAAQQGHGALAAFGTAAPVAACALLAAWGRPGRQVRTLAGSAGLIAAAALLVHTWSGQSEAWFAFFVVIGILALYQDWLPFVLAFGFVALHTGVLGAIEPQLVFGHAEGQADPWRWALIYGVFVLAASAASIAGWRANEAFLREPLTGLPGRSVFTHKLETARTEHPGSPVSVLFVDLDRFKGLNDSRGHRAGDELLSAVAARLVTSVRPGDTVARMGGDEFAVLCEGLGATDEALAVAERIRSRLRVPFRLASEEASISASVGVAVSNPGQDAEAVLSAADAAMYRAKKYGGDTCWLFDREVATEVAEQHRTQRELRRAVDVGQIEAHFQPVVSLQDGDVVGWEALARWRPRQGASVMPEAFIPAAEASGLIVPLGETVLRQACAELGSNTSHGFVSVNLSGRQLERAGFAQVVANALAESGVEPQRLCLEITENVLLDSSDAPIRTLAELKDLGIKLALDDFGTGQSSLAYLRRLPLDILKLDRSFIQELNDVGRNIAIVSAVLDMARSLDITVVAEGVETERQAACLRALDCELAQGFLFAAATRGMAPVAPRATAAAL